MCEWLSNNELTLAKWLWSKVYTVPVDEHELRVCSDLLHVLVEAKSSLYLCTQSSLKRDFTRLMWDDRWILGGKSDEQITGELRRTSFTGWMSSSCVDTYSLLKLVDLLIIICQLCVENKKWVHVVNTSMHRAINIQHIKQEKHTYCRWVCLYGSADELLLSSGAASPSSDCWRRQEVKVQASQTNEPPWSWSFPGPFTFCRWPESLLVWPVLSAGDPAGSETRGCRQCI